MHKSFIRNTSPATLKIWALICAVLLAISHMAAAAQTEAKPALQVFGEKFEAPQRMPVEQVRVIFYRTNPTQAAGAASIFVAGDYHTSLVAGGYSEVCVKPGQHELAVRSARANRNTYDSISALKLEAGQNYFVRVNDTQPQHLMLEPIAQSVAMRELADSRQQVHTISRVPDGECRLPATSTSLEAAAPIQAKPSTQTVVLRAAFLFARSDFEAVNVHGRIELDKLIDSIKKDYLALEEIYITGHADPLGNKKLNEQLAFQRAKTIGQYLFNNGLNKVHMTVEGRGDSELVRRDCNMKLMPESIDCNAPNRSVVISMTGTRR